MINGLAILNAFFTGVDDHGGIQSIINIPANDATAVPVDNGCQVKKSVLHWNVCNVNRPCLIGTVYDCIIIMAQFLESPFDKTILLLDIRIIEFYN